MSSVVRPTRVNSVWSCRSSSVHFSRFSVDKTIAPAIAAARISAYSRAQSDIQLAISAAGRSAINSPVASRVVKILSASSRRRSPAVAEDRDVRLANEMLNQVGGGASADVARPDRRTDGISVVTWSADNVKLLVGYCTSSSTNCGKRLYAKSMLIRPPVVDVAGVRLQVAGRPAAPARTNVAPSGRFTSNVRPDPGTTKYLVDIKVASVRTKARASRANTFSGDPLGGAETRSIDQFLFRTCIKCSSPSSLSVSTPDDLHRTVSFPIRVGTDNFSIRFPVAGKRILGTATGPRSAVIKRPVTE